MKLRLTSFLAFFCFSVVTLFAQEGSALKFEKTTHDFGEIPQGIPAEFTFKFTNSSSAAIKLTTVKASCGCTTPKWTTESIPPNGAGEIKVSYNAVKVGDFNKSVHVVYDSLELLSMNVYIKGKVLPKPGEEQNIVANIPGTEHKGDIVYGIPRGAISFENMIQSVNEVSSEGTGTVEYKFKNTSTHDVKILDEVVTDPEVTAVVQDKILKPGQESKIIVTVDGKKLKAANAPEGYFSKRITIKTDEPADNAKMMTVNGSFKRMFSETEKAKSPKIVFETIDVNGGTIIEGENFVFDYRFKNEGLSPLKIEGAKASCGCTAAKPPLDEIAPGASSAITVTFNSTGRLGKNTKTVSVTSNDINTPVITLKFTVEVVKDPFHSAGMMNSGQ